jgi:glycosyltransferase involved in cell wall biosynthesis
MKLSVIVATKNRALALAPCLDSIAAAFASAAPVDAEIVVVDNGSTDDTADTIKAWAGASAVPVQSLSEPRAGKARALNRGLRAARGDILAFTDDDCRLHNEHVNDLLRHAAADTDLVLRGGRIELGDPTDLPLTIYTATTPMRWSLALNSVRHEGVNGKINGCNMTMRRALVERLGPFDEDFGPGSRAASGDDTDYIFRAYLDGATLEYVPDMTVFHHHGRNTSAAGKKLIRDYMTAKGALWVKYIFKHPNFCRPALWNMKNAARETITGANTFLPNIGFSHKDKVTCAMRGAVRYFFMRKDRSAQRLWDEERLRGRCHVIE